MEHLRLLSPHVPKLLTNQQRFSLGWISTKGSVANIADRGRMSEKPRSSTGSSKRHDPFLQADIMTKEQGGMHEGRDRSRISDDVSWVRDEIHGRSFATS